MFDKLSENIRKATEELGQIGDSIKNTKGEKYNGEAIPVNSKMIRPMSRITTEEDLNNKTDIEIQINNIITDMLKT